MLCVLVLFVLLSAVCDVYRLLLHMRCTVCLVRLQSVSDALLAVPMSRTSTALCVTQVY